MKVPVLVLSALMLAACQPQAPTPVAAPGAPEPPAAPTEPAAPAAASTGAVAPSFDCANAANEIEKLVCADPELAAVDVRLAAVYDKELNRPETVKPAMAATQRGWVKGRDDCWKEEDKRRCVLEAYWTRLAELQINSPETTTPTPLEMRCDDNSQPVSAAFYIGFDPPTLVLTVGSDQALLFSQPSASGSKYGRAGAEFWEHQGETKIDFYGRKLACKPAGKAD